MNHIDLAKLDKALDAILDEQAAKRIAAAQRRHEQNTRNAGKAYGNAAMLAHANACTGRVNALDYLNTPDELPYQEIERVTRRMSFELAE